MIEAKVSVEVMETISKEKSTARSCLYILCHLYIPHKKLSKVFILLVTEDCEDLSKSHFSGVLRNQRPDCSGVRSEGEI